jgi:hypothetical protein
MFVKLSVADTIDSTLVGQGWTGKIVRVFPAVPNRRTEGASIHLDTPIGPDTIDILVFRRNKPSLFSRRQFVYVVPCPVNCSVDVDSVEVLKAASFIGEITDL